MLVVDFFPPQVLALSWTIASDKIMAKDNLRNKLKICLLVNVSVLCLCDAEDVHHLLMDCVQLFKGIFSTSLFMDTFLTSGES